MTVDAPTLASEPWVLAAVDVNADGLGVVLPAELVPGTAVQLSFRLDDETAFSQVPGVVLRKEVEVGAIGFQEWPEADRLDLLEYLVRYYEMENASPVSADAGGWLPR